MYTITLLPIIQYFLTWQTYSVLSKLVNIGKICNLDYKKVVLLSGFADTLKMSENKGHKTLDYDEVIKTSVADPVFLGHLDPDPVPGENTGSWSWSFIHKKTPVI